MRIISRKKIKDFWEQKQNSDAEEPLKAWYAETKNITWTSWLDVKAKYPKASI